MKKRKSYILLLPRSLPTMFFTMVMRCYESIYWIDFLVHCLFCHMKALDSRNICLSIYLSVYLSIYLPIYVSVVVVVVIVIVSS